MEKGGAPGPASNLESPPVSFPQTTINPSQQQSNEEPRSNSRSNDPSNHKLPSHWFTLTDLTNIAFQVVGVIIAAVFGAWAIKSYDSANLANRLSEDALSQSNIANRLAQDASQQSFYANVLSIINLCLSDQFRNTIECSAVLQAVSFASIIHGVIPSLPTTIPVATSLTTVTPTSLSSPPPGSTTPVLPPPPAPPPPESTTGTVSTPSISMTSYVTLTPPTSAQPTTGSGPGLAQTNHEIPFGIIVVIIVAVVITIAILCTVLVQCRRARVANKLRV